VNFVNFKTAKLFTSCLFLVLMTFSAQAWEVDMSRRQVDFDRIEDRKREPASVDVTDSILSLQKIIEPALPIQDVVIMNTENGFVPERVHLRKGQNYRVHLININEQKRNVSFILDDFSENHSTPYAIRKTFEIKPEKSGEFVFHSPETSFRGRMIVVDPTRTRTPASNK
jgi:hypothetical protein